jgi:hypothetical protein
MKHAVTGTTSDVVVSYAFDYGVMPNSGADRIVLADRPQGLAGARAKQPEDGESSPHAKRVVMVAADGHVGELMLERVKGSGSITTELYLDSGGAIRTDQATDAQTAPNSVTGDMNIYDDSADDIMQSAGSRNRAWLR